MCNFVYYLIIVWVGEDFNCMGMFFDYGLYNIKVKKDYLFLVILVFCYFFLL